MPARKSAALGFKAHTGWAAAVALAGPPAAPEVVAKRRIEMADGFEDAAVFHAGQEVPLPRAQALIRSSESKFAAAAREKVAALIAELRNQGCDVVAAAVVGGNPKPLPPLESILKSHALVHAAEGELFRRLLAEASGSCHVPAVLIAAKDLVSRAAAALGLSSDQVAAHLTAIGKASGTPWAADQKESALAAWIALAAGPGP